MNTQITVGAITFEEPYTVCAEGIAYKGKLAFEIKGDLSVKVYCELAKALNTAFQRGFSEGSQAMNYTRNL